MSEFVSIIIPCYNAGSKVVECLRSLSTQVGGVPHEIVVVDSSDDTRTRAEIAAFPNVRAILLDQRVSAGRARNVGASAARGRHLAFIDADCIASPTWLQGLARAWADGHRVIASALLPSPRGSVIGTAGFLPEFSQWLPSRERHVPHAPTAGFSIDVGLFREVGGFDEGLGTCEDTVFTHRLANAGHPPVLLSQSPVFHQNRTRWRDVWAHHRHLGKWGRRALLLRPPTAAQYVARHPILGYIAWPLRALRMMRHLWRSRSALGWDVLVALPLACILLIAWADAFARDPTGR